jgi:hypothetical protein
VYRYSEETFIFADKPATKLCLIKKGIVVAKGQVLNAGMVLGEEMLADRDRLNGYTAGVYKVECS